MKNTRFFFVGIIVLLMIAFAGCGNSGKKPDNMSDRAYELGCAALETTDDFIANKIGASDAVKKLDTVYDRIKRLVQDEKDELESDTLVGTDYFRDDLINTYILSITIDIQSKDRGTGTMSDVKESRNKLAKVLGK
ncbi:MAG: hypothetical protein IJ521_06060 [Schwartzia sp.]|nr:hypothetical protein [Schwartzia sp. (in: firmicutes)]